MREASWKNRGSERNDNKNHRRTTFVHDMVYCDMVNSCAIQHTYSLHVLHRNRHKKAKKARHEREKQYTEALGSPGHAVGEYVGGGQGDLEPEWTEDPDDDAEIAGDASDAMMNLQRTAANRLILCCSSMTVRQLVSASVMTTSEIAAKVVWVPVSSLSQPSFSSLVHTPHKITKVTNGTMVQIQLSE